MIDGPSSFWEKLKSTCQPGRHQAKSPSVTSVMGMTLFIVQEHRQSSGAQIPHCCSTFAALTELWESLDVLFNWKQKKKLVCNWEIHFQWICHRRNQRPGSSADIKMLFSGAGMGSLVHGSLICWWMSCRALSAPLPRLPQLRTADLGARGWTVGYPWNGECSHQRHHSTRWACLWTLPALNLLEN